MTEPYGPSTPVDPGDEPAPTGAFEPPPGPESPAFVPPPGPGSPASVPPMLHPEAPASVPSSPGPEAPVPAAATTFVPSAPHASARPPAATPATAARAARAPLRLLLRLAAAVVVVVVGVAAYLVFFQKSDPTAAKVGDCVSITGSSDRATAKRLACDDELALYVVTASGRSVTCDASEVSYTGGSRDRAKLCLFYNVRVGDCLKVTQSGDGDTKGACTAGMLKVVAVMTDTSDAEKCPPQSDAARTDEARNRLICFATVT